MLAWGMPTGAATHTNDKATACTRHDQLMPMRLRQYPAPVVSALRAEYPCTQCVLEAAASSKRETISSVKHCTEPKPKAHTEHKAILARIAALHAANYNCKPTNHKHKSVLAASAARLTTMHTAHARKPMRTRAQHEAHHSMHTQSARSWLTHTTALWSCP